MTRRAPTSTARQSRAALASVSTCLALTCAWMLAGNDVIDHCLCGVTLSIYDVVIRHVTFLSQLGLQTILLVYYLWLHELLKLSADMRRVKVILRSRSKLALPPVTELLVVIFY